MIETNQWNNVKVNWNIHIEKLFLSTLMGKGEEDQTGWSVFLEKFELEFQSWVGYGFSWEPGVGMALLEEISLRKDLTVGLE